MSDTHEAIAAVARSIRNLQRMTTQETAEDPRVTQARDTLRYWDDGTWLDWNLLRPMSGELAAALRSLLEVTDERSKS